MEIREKYDGEYFLVGEFKSYKSLASSHDEADFLTKRHLRTQIFTDGVLVGVNEGKEHVATEFTIENGKEYKSVNISKFNELLLEDYSYIIKYVVSSKEDRYDFNQSYDDLTIILNDEEDKKSLAAAIDTLKQLNTVYNNSEKKIEKYNKALKNVYVLKR